MRRGLARNGGRISSAIGPGRVGSCCRVITRTSSGLLKYVHRSVYKMLRGKGGDAPGQAGGRSTRMRAHETSGRRSEHNDMVGRFEHQGGGRRSVGMLRDERLNKTGKKQNALGCWMISEALGSSHAKNLQNFKNCGAIHLNKLAARNCPC